MATEVHGQREHWSTIKRQFAKSHKIFHSYDPNSPNKAGVALIIKLKIYNQSFRDEIFEVVQGRVITIRLHLKKGCLALTSIHNFELNEAL